MKKIKITTAILAFTAGLLLFASAYYAYQGDYPRANFDMLLGYFLYTRAEGNES